MDTKSNTSGGADLKPQKPQGPDTDALVDAWASGFANTPLAANTECYSFVMQRLEELKASLKG